MESWSGKYTIYNHRPGHANLQFQLSMLSMKNPLFWPILLKLLGIDSSHLVVNCGFFIESWNCKLACPGLYIVTFIIALICLKGIVGLASFWMYVLHQIFRKSRCNFGYCCCGDLIKVYRISKVFPVIGPLEKIRSSKGNKKTFFVRKQIIAMRVLFFQNWPVFHCKSKFLLSMCRTIAKL